MPSDPFVTCAGIGSVPCPQLIAMPINIHLIRRADVEMSSADLFSSLVFPPHAFRDSASLSGHHFGLHGASGSRGPRGSSSVNAKKERGTAL